MQWSPLLINTVSSLEAALWHLSPRVCKYLLRMEQYKPSLPAERRACFLFLSLMVFYRTAEYFLSFSSILEVTTKGGGSEIITFLSSFISTHFSFHLLVPVILCIGTQWVSGTFTLCVCCIFWWRHSCSWEQNFLLLTNQGWKQPALLIFLLNEVRTLKYCLLSTGFIILPTSLP